MPEVDDVVERVARAMCGRDLDWRDCESSCVAAGKCVGNLNKSVIGDARAAIAATGVERMREALRTITHMQRQGPETDVLAWANLAQGMQMVARQALSNEDQP